MFDIDFARSGSYTAAMLLRRATVLASLIAYLGVAICRQGCALDLPAPRPESAVASPACARCPAEAPASRRSSRRPAPCCVQSARNASVLPPAQTALVPAPSFSVALVFMAPPAALRDSSLPSILATRAPPGAAPSALAPALHGPRPPPSLLAVL